MLWPLRRTVSRLRSGQVPVPEVVVDKLEVPDPLACFQIQSEQAVGEKVLTNAVPAPEIKGG
ncbi:MAG: hypothetical protein U1G07_22005 [Verrucomicrobiota bacterium]